MKRYRIFVSEPMPALAFGCLDEIGEVIFGSAGPPYKEAELSALVRDVDALICTSRDAITASVIDSAPGLQVITKAGGKPNNVDYAAAEARGIPVTWTPNANAVSVAEHTVALMLAVAKRLMFVTEHLKAGGWRDETILGVELAGKTAAIIGLGAVGAAVARRLTAFEMRLLGYDPFKSKDVLRQLGIEPVDFERALAEADFLLFHCELTDATRHLISEDQLKSMKPSAIVVNTARGAVINEAALRRALREGWISGAGLDVFETEPLPADDPLLALPTLVATPHSAAYTNDGHLREARWAAEDVRAILKGSPPIHWRPSS